MEKQPGTNVELNDPVTITILQSEDATLGARFIDFSADHVNVRLNTGLEVGSLLKLEFADDLMITEVSHCEPDQGEFTAGLSILSWLEKAELQRLRREAVAGLAPQA